MNTPLALMLVSVLGCKARVEPETPAANDQVAALVSKYTAVLATATAKVDADGWLMTGRGDAARYFGGACEVLNGNFEAAESKTEPGMFCRSPDPKCWELQDSPTTWSRDAGLGLMWCGWETQNRAMLERHADYGRAHNWVMSIPADDGRGIYTPNHIGLLFQVIYAMGGPDNPNRLIPAYYPSGLDDFEAALQVLSILLRGEVTGSAPLMGTTEPLTGTGLNIVDIPETSRRRLQEHAAREPHCPLYLYAEGLYSGDLGPAVTALLETPGECQYLIRPDNVDMLLLDFLFVANKTLKAYGAL